MLQSSKKHGHEPDTFHLTKILTFYKKVYYLCVMIKRMLTIVALLLVGVAAWAQEMAFGEEIPQAAVEVLQPRLVQMLQGVDAPLQVEARIVKQMETPGSLSQVALEIELTLRSGEVVQTFILKGVGENEADAWVRASKQFLPRSKAAQAFVARLKP